MGLSVKIFLRLLVLVITSVCVARGSENSEELRPTNHRFFLQQIFNKYGHGGVMKYEGFEHLLENLGLGRLAFEKSHDLDLHKVNGTFREVHDAMELHQHDHDDSARKRRETDNNDSAVPEQFPALQDLIQDHDEVEMESTKDTFAECLSAQEILITYGLEPYHSEILPISFLHLCPAIIYELDHRSCYQTLANHAETEHEKENTEWIAWMYGAISVFVISLCGLLGAAMIPLMQMFIFKQILQFLIAMAVGTLTGDALLHLIPHALTAHDSRSHGDHTSDSTWSAFIIFVAVLIFFTIERFLMLLKTSHKQQDKETTASIRLYNNRQQSESGGQMSDNDTEDDRFVNVVSHGHSHGAQSQGKISASALMVIAGDALHNFTDGLAIGAAFSTSLVAGFSTALAVLCHELPHELGDFAVLIQSGVGIFQVLKYNLMSTILSFAGLGTGLLLGNVTSQWVFAAAAGIFIYVALVDLIPALNKMSDVETSPKTREICLQVVGIAVGGIIMLFIALYEEELQEFLEK